MIELLTERLKLRRWTEQDFAPFAEMNADPRVMEFFEKRLSREESATQARRTIEHFERCGFGNCVIETRDDSQFVGIVGLWRASFDAHFMPCVEIGWRLAHAHWGKGYATEAAREVLRYAFEELKLSEVVSYTVPLNVRSRAVMDKLGMKHDPSEDFDHPKIHEGHPLRRHVLYRLRPTCFNA